jgi:DNA-binding cell septation regulator SpoVG
VRVCDVRMSDVLSFGDGGVAHAHVSWCVAVLLRRQPNTTKSQTIRLLKYKSGLYVTLPATKRNVSTYKAHTHTLSLSLTQAYLVLWQQSHSDACVCRVLCVRCVCVCV